MLRRLFSIGDGKTWKSAWTGLCIWRAQTSMKATITRQRASCAQWTIHPIESCGTVDFAAQARTRLSRSEPFRHGWALSIMSYKIKNHENFIYIKNRSPSDRYTTYHLLSNAEVLACENGQSPQWFLYCASKSWLSQHYAVALSRLPQYQHNSEQNCCIQQRR